ncbi:MAG: ABC transporter permease [Planctomycetaceae bacterium]
MALPLTYNLRSLLLRRTATLMTGAGIACVVAVFISVMGLAEGFRAAVATTGRADRALILRDGSSAEINSAIDRGAWDLLRTLPLIAAGPAGQPLATADMVIVLNHGKLPDGAPTNVTVRGMAGGYRALRAEVRLAQGAWFTPGSAEVMVGRALEGRLQDCRIGGTIRQAGRDWTVVGVFSAGGSAFESEIWGDAEVMLDAFDRRVFQSVTLGLRAPGDADALAELFAGDLRLKTLDATREDRYYEAQSGMLTGLIQGLGIFIGVLMAIGAVVGAMNTMYAAVAGRQREIATLLAMGFAPGAIFLSFLLESLLLSLAGSLLGCLLSLPVNGIATGTTNWATFSEVAFAFKITPSLFVSGILFGLVMGALGGALPALRAARMPAAAALTRL